MNSLLPRIFLAAAVACGAASSVGISHALAQVVNETPKDIIAAHIRTQGFACDKPISAVKDREHSKPDAPVWLLKCEDHTYQVRLIPDMAADVHRVD